MRTNREVRESLRVTQLDVAFHARVAEVTVRVFESDPAAVKNPDKRRALERVYEDLRSKACKCGSPEHHELGRAGRA